MPTRDDILQLVRLLLNEWIKNADDVWAAIYRLLLDYIYDVPRITDSNRLVQGVWRERAKQIEQSLAMAIGCQPNEVVNYLDVLMRQLYPPDTQRMNPIGIAFACALVELIQRFGEGVYNWKMEARIPDVFPMLTGFRRSTIDIVAFRERQPYAVVSSKWGIRHDRVRDPQEEADTYKQQLPSLKFLLVTNEFDSARLQKVLHYPTIDGVFHVRRDLVWQVYGGAPQELANLKDITELFSLFP